MQLWNVVTIDGYFFVVTIVVTIFFVRNPKYGHEKFDVNGNTYEDVGVTMTYIIRDIQFHISEIDYLKGVWMKMKKLFL